MIKRLFIFAFCCLLSSIVNAQPKTYKNAIQLGAEYVVLSTPQDYGLRYSTRYNRQLANDRWLIEASIGYLSATGLDVSLPTGSKKRQRITGELTFLYDFLISPIHALRLGVGPSIWNRQDYARGIDTQFTLIHATDMGAHALIEYEYRLSARLSLSARYGVTYFDVPGPSSMGGVAVGYRF